MSINLLGRNFLTLKDYSKEEIEYLIDLSIKLKNDKKKNIYNYNLKNKNIALIFEKTSTRTRCAASVACFDEGGHAEFLGKDDIQLQKKESVEDTAKVLGRMYDAILFRGYKQKTLEILAEFSKIPVINGLTDDYHPTQVIADLMSIKERFGRLEGLKLVYCGDGQNNVAASLLIGCAKMNVGISIASPKKLRPKKHTLEYIKSIDSKSVIDVTENIKKAVKDADAVYTDVWLSMGEEKKKYSAEKVKMLKPYQISKKVMEYSGKESTVFLHCLPASHNGMEHHLEVTEKVFTSANSIVFDQAENRMHSIKAILVAILGENK